MKANNYIRVLNMMLRFGHCDLTEIHNDYVPEPNVYMFRDIVQSHREAGSLLGTSMGIDTYFVYTCAYTPVNSIPMMLFWLGILALDYNLHLEVGTCLTFERCSMLQVAAKDYLSHNMETVISFTDFLSGKELPFVYFVNNLDKDSEVYAQLAKPEVAGILYLIQHYSTSATLFFPKSLEQYCYNYSFYMSKDDLIDIFTESGDDIKHLEILHKMTMLFTAIKQDANIATEIWRDICCSGQLPDDIYDVAQDAKHFLDKCGIVETRW